MWVRWAPPTHFALAVLLAGALTQGVRAQTPLVSPHNDAAPGELADPIEALMAAGGQRVSIGRTTLEFWWVKSLPLTAESNDVGWSAVEEGTLVGAVRLSGDFTDIHARKIKRGIYTLRYAQQPQDGASREIALRSVLL